MLFWIYLTRYFLVFCDHIFKCFLFLINFFGSTVFYFNGWRIYLVGGSIIFCRVRTIFNLFTLFIGAKTHGSLSSTTPTTTTRYTFGFVSTSSFNPVFFPLCTIILSPKFQLDHMFRLISLSHSFILLIVNFQQISIKSWHIWKYLLHTWKSLLRFWLLIQWSHLFLIYINYMLYKVNI